jgi:hypothetical protein
MTVAGWVRFDGPGQIPCLPSRKRANVHECISWGVYENLISPLHKVPIYSIGRAVGVVGRAVRIVLTGTHRNFPGSTPIRESGRVWCIGVTRQLRPCSSERDGDVIPQPPPTMPSERGSRVKPVRARSLEVRIAVVVIPATAQILKSGPRRSR